MVNVANIVRKATISCTMVCELVAVFYVSLRLFLLKSSDNNLIYRGYFLYNTSVSPNYELTMIGQTLAAVYGAAVYAAVDTFIAMLVLHACGQLSNLKNDLKTIRLYDRDDLQAKLKKIVDKHNYISGFVWKSSFRLLRVTLLVNEQRKWNKMYFDATFSHTFRCVSSYLTLCFYLKFINYCVKLYYIVKSVI